MTASEHIVNLVTN